MRIREWSSDVCYSELTEGKHLIDDRGKTEREIVADAPNPEMALQYVGRVVEKIERLQKRRQRRDTGKRLSGKGPCQISLQNAIHVALRSHWGRRMPRRRSEEHTSELQSLMRISYAVFC